MSSLNEQTDASGRVHPRYSFSEHCRIMTRSPNIAQHKLDHFRAAPGKVLVLPSPTKLDAVYLCREKGENDLAKELASTKLKLGEYILTALDRPLTGPSVEVAKSVIYKGLLGVNNPDESTDHTPLWRDMVRKWPGLRQKHTKEVGRAEVRAAYTKVTQMLLQVTTTLEDQFPGNVTGIFIDTPILECDPSVHLDVVAWLSKAYPKAMGCDVWLYDYANKCPLNDEGAKVTRTGLLFEDL